MARPMSRTASAAAAAATLAMLVTFVMSLQGTAAEKVHTQTFRSPGFTLGPGDVTDKYFEVEMPKGFIAIRSFNAQVVDENGVPVPLSETYLHHWLLLEYYKSILNGAEDRILVSNGGPCQDLNLVQLFGLGSETRRTDTLIPSPYGIAVGDPEKVPEGYEDVWVLNVHAIDTRGAVDKRGCAECACDLYSLTEAQAQKVGPDYVGGLYCCQDAMHCDVLPDYEGAERTLFMEYYVSWVDMSDDVVPVTIYILDVTDGKTSANAKDSCKVEYTVPKCAEGETNCVHKHENLNFLPNGGDVVYAVGHQHTGGLGSSLYNEDGTEICTSLPEYGNGTDPGNEVGYIVGMSTCYPKPGTVSVKAHEKLRMTSWYSNEDRHTGVMGLFYLLVDESAQQPPKASSCWHLVPVGTALLGAVLLVGAVVSIYLKKRRAGGSEYQLVGP